jgi:hypothetical protein
MLIPYVYAYRPSNSSVVGTFAWLSGGTAIRGVTAAGMLSLGPYAGGTASNVYQWSEWAVQGVRNFYTTADVTVQVGDLLCYEVWLLGRATISYDPINYSVELDCGRDGTTLYDQTYGDSSQTLRDKTTFFYVDDLQQTTVQQLLDPGNTLASPNLTAVSPGTGPHISLTFDNPVGITGPTIGGPSDGLGVTGVSAISTTQIDLACAIRPDHPDGDANNATLVPPIGEADPLGPPVPTGVGATII